MSSGLIVSFVFSVVSVSAATDLDCSDFTYQDQAQSYFISVGGSSINNADHLDADSDGQACELLPRRATSTTPLSTYKASDEGYTWFWPLAILTAAAGGVWYYLSEIQGEQNRRAPRTPGATYHPSSMPYEAYLKTPEWYAVRKMALDRDGNKCAECSSTSRLQAHHLTYKRRGHEKVKDLTTLCNKCHERRHQQSRAQTIRR